MENKLQTYSNQDHKELIEQLLHEVNEAIEKAYLSGIDISLRITDSKSAKSLCIKANYSVKI